MVTHVPSTATGSQFLRRTLQLDGTICLVSGLAMVAAAGQLATLTGILSPLVIGILGAALAAYAAMLFVAARQERFDRRTAIVSMALDLLWIAGSAVLLLTDVLPLTAAGWWIILVLALGVAGMAEAKFYGLWRTRQA